MGRQAAPLFMNINAAKGLRHEDNHRPKGNHQRCLSMARRH
jgi:hypothetical protein